MKKGRPLVTRFLGNTLKWGRDMRIRYVIPGLVIGIAILVLVQQHVAHRDKKGFFNAFYRAHTVSINTEQVPVWLNIFIHGSFGSALGFLSLPSVFDDKVRGSVYREANKRVRDDEFFYKDQPILKRGLTQFTPSFNRADAHNKFHAVYPLAKAYQTLLEWSESEILKKDETQMAQHYFYTFGWSGLLSQSSRRFEAIRLYNALTEELAAYHARGVYPRLRIIAHSHGGNLSLNLAAIQYVLHSKTFNFDDQALGNADAQSSVKAMFELIKSLPAREEALNNPGQKRWDYVPERKDLCIDQLIMYGSPIQPETASFCCAPIFRRIYNFYSGEDVIQRIDWITTKRYFSDQRIHNAFFGAQQWEDVEKKVYQARIMVNREWGKLQDVQADDNQQVTLWDMLFSGKSVLARKTNDPTHRELWYCAWKKSESDNNIFAPIPFFVFTPLMVTLIDLVNDDRDIDLNLKLTPESMKVSLAHHNQVAILNRCQIPRSLFESIKTRLSLWRPDDATLAEEFDAVYKHLL